MSESFMFNVMTDNNILITTINYTLTLFTCIISIWISISMYRLIQIITNNHISDKVIKHQCFQTELQSKRTYKTSKYLICIDWDNTLFPSTKLNTNYDNPPVDIIKIGLPLYELLYKAIKYYGADNVKIVTNSLDGWILYSLNICCSIHSIFKDIKNLIIESKIELISARSTYSKYCNSIYSNFDYLDTFIWKKNAFDCILTHKLYEYNKLNIDMIHIITIGDSWNDHDTAAISLKCNITYYLKYNNK
eukprot:520318_1